MNQEANFRRAIRQPEYRQEFLDGIDLEYAAAFMQRPVYTPKTLWTRNADVLMDCRMRYFLKESQARVRVYEPAFSGKFIRSLGEFQSCLIDHEGNHAREKCLELDNAHTVFGNEAELAETQNELRAYRNQARMMGAKRKVSGRFADKIYRQIHRLKLEEARINEELFKESVRCVESFGRLIMAMGEANSALEDSKF